MKLSLHNLNKSNKAQCSLEYHDFLDGEESFEFFLKWRFFYERVVSVRDACVPHDFYYSSYITFQKQKHEIK